MSNCWDSATLDECTCRLWIVAELWAHIWSTKHWPTVFVSCLLCCTGAIHLELKVAGHRDTVVVRCYSCSRSRRGENAYPIWLVPSTAFGSTSRQTPSPLLKLLLPPQYLSIRISAIIHTTSLLFFTSGLFSSKPGNNLTSDLKLDCNGSRSNSLKFCFR